MPTWHATAGIETFYENDYQQRVPLHDSWLPVFHKYRYILHKQG
jgi:hypothetical protein